MTKGRKLTKTERNLVIAVCLFSAFIVMRNMTAPLLSYIIDSYPQYDETYVKTLTTVPGAVGAVVAFLIGPLCTVISRKKLMIFTAFTCMVYMLAFAFVGSNSMAVLMGVTYLVGFAQGAAAQLINGSMAETFDGEERAKYIALAMGFFNFGTAMMSHIGGAIAGASNGANWNQAYFAGFIYIPIILVLIFMMPNSKPKKGTTEELKAASGNKASWSEVFQKGGLKKNFSAWLFLVILLQAVFYIGVQTYNTNISQYVIKEYELGTSAVSGFATSLYRYAGMIVGFIYPVLQKIFKKMIVPAGYLLTAVGTFMLFIKTDSVMNVYIASALLGAALNMANNTVYAKATLLTSPRFAGIALSLNATMQYLATSISPYALKYGAVAIGGDNMPNRLVAGVVFAAVAGVLAMPLYLKDIRFANASNKKDNTDPKNS